MAEILKKGIFITFEGPEGSGKSTHSRRLVKDLQSDGYDAVRTQEPGSTPLGRKIRDILLEKENISLNKHAELFLFEADRAQHVEEVIRPALREKKIVICDRFNTATFAYQGYGLGTAADLIEKVDAASTGGLRPDLTLLLDLDVKTGLSRAGAAHAADRMEKRSPEFHEKVRQGYLDFAEKHPETVKILNVRDDIDRTYDLIKSEVYDFIKGHKGSE